MKLPELQTPKTAGIGTTGAAGCIILAGVIWAQLDPWWLVASILLILSGIGQENARR